MRTAKEQPEPERYGWQDDGTYAPTQDEIRAACAEIQETWSRRERARRAGTVIKKYRIPEVHDPIHDPH